MPRQPVGETLMIENIPVAADGTFSVDLGTTMVTGAANPITGSDIEAALSLQGFIQSQDLFCGLASGMVTVPLVASLDGSTFAASRVTAIDALPEMFPLKCP